MASDPVNRPHTVRAHRNATRIVALRHASRAAARPDPRSRLPRILGAVLLGVGLTTFIAVAMSIVMMTTAVGVLSVGLPDPSQLEALTFSQPTVVYDRSGTVELGRFQREERRVVAFGDVPELVLDATTSAEDRTFWANGGFDAPAIISAAAEGASGSRERGASTITQQLVRARLLPSEVTSAGADRYMRKAKELIQAMRVSETFPGEQGKDRIITAYLNEIFYGHGAYGIAAAALIYFGVSDLAELTPAQAALLAGLPKSPSTLDPYRYAVRDDEGRLVVPPDAPPVVRRDWILDGLGEGARWTKLTQTELAAARAEPVVLAGEQALTYKAAHFTWQVRRQLDTILGSAEKVETGGYKVITTLDMKAQGLAEKWLTAGAIVPNVSRKKGDALMKSLKIPKADRSWVRALRGKDLHNGALVALDYRTGDVLAYAGSAGYYRDDMTSRKFSPKYDAAGDGSRQPGSAFKPILYAAAFNAKVLTPGSLLLDVTTEFNRREDWAPRDADQLERGPVLVRKALQYSLNIPAIRTLERVGNSRVDKTAEALGLRFTGGREAYLQSGLAGALGTVEVRPLDLTSAYGALANGGVRVPPRMILAIEGPDGKVVWQAPEPEGTAAVSPQAAFLVTDILAGNTDKKQNPIWAEKLALYNGKGGEPPPGRGQDRHVERRTRPRDLRLPRAAEGRPPGPRGRRLDGQQRPLQPALEGAGDLADRGRSAVARVRARLLEVLAGHRTSSGRSGPGQGDHRRLDRRQARPVDQGQDDRLVHRRDAAGRQEGDRSRRPAVHPCLRKLASRPGQGRARAIELGRRRRRLDAPCSRRPRSDRAVRLADGLLLEAVVVGWPDRRGVLPAQARSRQGRQGRQAREAREAAEAARADRAAGRRRHRPDHGPVDPTMRQDLTPWTVRGMGLAIGVAIVVALIGLAVAAGGVLVLLFVAILLASALEPMVGLIRDRFPLGRGATILVVYATFFVTVVGLAFIVVPKAISQGQEIVASLPAFLDSVRSWASTLRPAILGQSVTELADSVESILSQSTTPDPDQVVEVGAAAAEAAVALATLLTIVYFWLVQHARLQRYMLAFIPAERRAGARDAWNEIETRLGLWVRGQLILMGTMGVATGIAYTLLGLPGALLLGADRGHRRSDPDHRPAARGHPGGPRRGDRVTRAGGHRCRRLHRHPARRRQRPRPDGHAQHDRAVAVAGPPEPARRRGGRRPRRRASWRSPSSRRSRSCWPGCRRARRPSPRTRPPSRPPTRRRVASTSGRSPMPGTAWAHSRADPDPAQRSAATAIPRECSRPRRSTSAAPLRQSSGAHRAPRSASGPRTSPDRRPPAGVRAVRPGNGRCRPSRGSRRRPPTRWPCRPAVTRPQCGASHQPDV